MSYKRKRKTISHIKKVLENELLRFSEEEFREITELLYKAERDSGFVVPLVKRIYEIIKWKPPEEKRKWKDEK